MRISDWSSDVCSSDLALVARIRHAVAIVVVRVGAELPAQASGCRPQIEGVVGDWALAVDEVKVVTTFETDVEILRQVEERAETGTDAAAAGPFAKELERVAFDVAEQIRTHVPVGRRKISEQVQAEERALVVVLLGEIGRAHV